MAVVHQYGVRLTLQLIREYDGKKLYKLSNEVRNEINPRMLSSKMHFGSQNTVIQCVVGRRHHHRRHRHRYHSLCGCGFFSFITPFFLLQT